MGATRDIDIEKGAMQGEIMCRELRLSDSLTVTRENVLGRPLRQVADLNPAPETWHRHDRATARAVMRRESDWILTSS